MGGIESNFSVNLWSNDDYALDLNWYQAEWKDLYLVIPDNTEYVSFRRII